MEANNFEVIKSPPLPFSAFWPMQRYRNEDGRIVTRPAGRVPEFHFGHLT